MLSIVELQSHGLSLEAVVSSLFYSLVGLGVMIGAIMACNKLMSLNLRKEVLEDHNTSAAIVIAGLCVSVALIICASIV